MSAEEFQRVATLCRQRKWALIVDEVFADYPLDASTPLTDVAVRSEVLCFTLAGLSKTIGLPQLKLGWCIAGGPAAERDAALAALEVIADSYLSVGTPVQVATPTLLSGGASILGLDTGKSSPQSVDAARHSGRIPRVRGTPRRRRLVGVLSIPSTRGEESVVLDLLRTERVLVHPGYFFDFPREAYLVVSLLPPEESFADAVARLLRFVQC